MMRVEVERISDEELLLNDDISAQSWDLDSSDVHFIDTIHLECNFKKAGPEILVDGTATLSRLITCSRCLNEAKQKVHQPFTLSYNKGSLGEFLDIDNDVREEILLNFPMKVLCSDECKGICPGCGANLNTEECKCQMKT